MGGLELVEPINKKERGSNMEPDKKELMHTFLKSLFGVDSIDSYVLLCGSKQGLHSMMDGDFFKLQGILDFAKKDHAMKVYQKQESEKKGE